MRLLGNIIWFIFGGFISGMAWVVSGILWCITVIGIPYGLQCFKFATMSFCPFGRRIEYGGGVISFLVDVVWFLLNGWWMALVNFLIGCLWFKSTNSLVLSLLHSPTLTSIHDHRKNHSLD